MGHERRLIYYNCARPDLILASGRILTSPVFRGVSLSEWADLGSHGPFKLALRRGAWFDQFRKVEYGPGHKPVMFADEREWVSSEPVVLPASDVLWVMFMENAPCCIGPRILKRVQAALSGPLYRVGRIPDPYLRR